MSEIDIYLNMHERKLNLKDVLVAPNLKKKFLSVGKFTLDNLCTFEFIASNFLFLYLFIKDQNKKTIARGCKKVELIALDGFPQEALINYNKER